ncbi:MAG: bifunctional 23S rRNA (guanine(2069)-N(7))-methyltransferase RlmK/23S rRNA (guanine(2445)-N(2))-methyltransferase RlmL [Pseudomonadota bacterium]|nr:bifunctional 23S rRNA (guanine(2069)-N(7))-methyltransferase RlmK/23S rRNA (guanine(2445)-N(2))-methyltransferase RlmL [Pseudomonadota bacterium]
MSFSVFVTTPKGLENLLVQEIQSLLGHSTAIQATRAGVSIQADLAQAYRICLWSRLANRVLLTLTRFPTTDTQSLYEGIQTIRWDEHLAVQGSFAVEFSGQHPAINNTHFGALKVKDAIVDQFRAHHQYRPRVVLSQPDIRIHVHVHEHQASVSLDLAGESLHRRGYRVKTVTAPLKENLAAALLLHAQWPQWAKQGACLIDPMCGSGTLVIEAALMAADRAPQLNRRYFGFLNWRQHQAQIWDTLLAEAQQRQAQGLAQHPIIIGYDTDEQAVQAALANVAQAGLRAHIKIEQRALTQLTAPQSLGLVISNLPYGERLGNQAHLKPLYHQLGQVLTRQFSGWQAALFIKATEGESALGLQAYRRHQLYNGALPCQLLCFDLKKATTPTSGLHHPQQAQMFANRLRKNIHDKKRWAQRNGIHCFRLYDADLPDYALSIDVYEHWLHVQEYAPPSMIDSQKAHQRLQDALTLIATLMPEASIFLKTRQRHRGKQQYEKLNHSGQFYEVREQDAIFLVNFTDYLDTGLFLDHRLTRQLIRSWAQGKHFLNLYGYTGTATVHAALGGAQSTTTVDSSKTYLNWAQRNLNRNAINTSNHQLIQADCLTWLQQQLQNYDLIFLDSPTFSNSKQLTHHLDIQRDHVALIQAAVKRLAPGGTLLFSTHYQKFKLDQPALKPLQIAELTSATLPQDFARRPRIHQCWKITL